MENGEMKRRATRERERALRETTATAALNAGGTDGAVRRPAKQPTLRDASAGRPANEPVEAAPLLLRETAGYPAWTSGAPPPTGDLLEGIEAISEFVGVDFRRGGYLIRAGQLPTFKMGTRVYMRKSSYWRHLAKLESEAEAARLAARETVDA
jgi:hypothetical protein